MHLVLAAAGRLAAAYGAAYPAVAAALTEALAARAAAGIASLPYDPEVGLLDLAVPPTMCEPDSLVAQLRAIQAALTLRGGIIESLWIIGGPQVVPFGSLPNPLPDRDGPILGDTVYGLADTDNLLPHWPVGRTPDCDPPGLLADLLRQTAAAHASGPRPCPPPLAISTARWARVSAEVLERSGGGALQLAPPLRAGAPARTLIAEQRLIYGNLHGVRNTLAWYGQPEGDSELTPALRPQDLAGLKLPGTLVISQACFGARLDRLDGMIPLAPALLAAGAAAVITPTGLSYGAPDPPPGESDLLAIHLLATCRKPGMGSGGIMQAAQQALLRELLISQGRPHADDVKTLLSFVLYGDPALRWTS